MVATDPLSKRAKFRRRYSHGILRRYTKSFHPFGNGRIAEPAEFRHDIRNVHAGEIRTGAWIPAVFLLVASGRPRHFFLAIEFVRMSRQDKKEIGKSVKKDNAG
jgi:hypothetical protein